MAERDAAKRLAYEIARRKDPKRIEWKRSWTAHMSPTSFARQLLRTAKCRAKRLGLEFAIDLADIPIPSHCPLLGIPLDCSAAAFADGKPSLDRKDNSKGYVRGNVWVISWRANDLKANAHLSELETLVANLKVHQFRQAAHAWFVRANG